MPLVVYRPNAGNHAVLPITLRTTYSLILVLCYLQCLYLVSFLARPIWSSHRDFPPFRHTIERVEKAAIDIIISIVPLANYHSPNHPSMISTESLAHHPVTPAYASRFANGGNHPTNPPYLTRPSVPECYPATAPEAARVSARIQSSTPTPVTPLTPVAPVERYTKTGISVYEAVKRVTTTSQSPRARVSGVIDINALSQRSNYSPRTTREENGKVREKEREDEFQDAQSSIILPLPSAAAYRPYATARAGQKSPAISLLSLDGPHDLFSAKQSHEASTEVDGEGPSKQRGGTLKLGHKSNCHSTESYPGKFPVSEGMDFSELATAEYAFRERGTTTVRPFSDY